MAVDEISSNERVGSPDVKSLMCIIHFQHGGPKAVNTVDEVGGGGDLHSILITQLFAFCMRNYHGLLIMIGCVCLLNDCFAL